MENNNNNYYLRIGNKLNINNFNQQQCTQNRINSSIECKFLKVGLGRMQEELRINKWRFQTDYPIFKIVHFSFDSMASEHAIAKIVYQVPHLSFDKLTVPLNLSNCLYTLKSILMACQKLIDQFGFFKLTPKMVGITQEGICKIWVNESFQKNQILHLARTQEQMVQSILNMISKLLKQGKLEQEFINDLREEKRSAVRIDQLIWKFSYKKSILIPPFFEFSQAKYKVSKIANRHKKTLSTSTSYSQDCQVYIQPKNQYNFSEFDLQTAQRKKKQFDHDSFRELYFEKKDTLKLINRSNQNYGMIADRESLISKLHCPYKSDFITSEQERRRASYGSTEKESLLSKNISRLLISQKIDQEKESKKQTKAELNKEKMKNMIKQKIKLNLEKRKIVELQTINTVISIGEFTESEKKIIEDGNINNLQLIYNMGRRIENSYLHEQLNFGDSKDFPYTSDMDCYQNGLH